MTIETQPRIYRNWQGVPCPMPTPDNARLVASWGSVELWELKARGQYPFSVVYGLELSHGLTYAKARERLGECLLHSLQCEGKLDG